MSLNKGISYVEYIVALAVLGMCVLILSPSITLRKDHFRKTQLHLRAVTALASEADLIRRTRGPALAGGRHAFIQESLLLKGLPGAEAHYEVSSSPLRGMARVTLSLSWKDRQRQSREMQIYVRR